MKIELKKIRVDERMSEETICFSADLYFDGKKAGIAYNEGHGGMTWAKAENQAQEEILSAAKKYAASLPPKRIPPIDKDDKELIIPMALDVYIDNLLNDYMAELDTRKFRADVLKKQEFGILYGTPDKEYAGIKFKISIAEILKRSNGREILKSEILKNILPNMKHEHTILNSNLPKELLDLEKGRHLKPRQILPEPTKRKKRR